MTFPVPRTALGSGTLVGPTAQRGRSLPTRRGPPSTERGPLQWGRSRAPRAILGLCTVLGKAPRAGTPARPPGVTGQARELLCAGPLLSTAASLSALGGSLVFPGHGASRGAAESGGDALGWVAGAGPQQQGGVEREKHLPQPAAPPRAAGTGAVCSAVRRMREIT